MDETVEDLLEKAKRQLKAAKLAVDKVVELDKRIVDSQNDLKKALTFVLQQEGGYVNDPVDRGGETKWGISKRAYPNEDIPNLTRERALEIYANDYWLASGCDLIPYPYCVAVFDSAVNCGVGRAMGWYKEAKDIDDFLEKRKQHYINIVNKDPLQVRFARGWWARLADLKKYCEIHKRT
jgi:Glycosyl hydrolase 108